MRRCLLFALMMAAAASFASPGTVDLKPVSTEISDQPPLQEIPVPALEEFPGLVASERQLEFEVSRYYASDGARWIRLRSQFDSAFRAKAEDILATLWDFEGSPKVFSRIEESHVRSLSDDGTVAVTVQRTGVRILGFAYLSDVVFRTELKRNGPVTKVESEAIEVDHTVLTSRNSWILVEGQDASGPITYVRYSLDSYVAPKFPVQEWLMRKFGGSDMRELIRELRAATTKRAKAGRESASR